MRHKLSKCSASFKKRLKKQFPLKSYVHQEAKIEAPKALPRESTF
jgi:hypothetical protein